MPPPDVPQPSGLDTLTASIRALRENNEWLKGTVENKKAEVTRIKMLLQRILRSTSHSACSDSEAWSMAEDIVDGRT